MRAKYKISIIIPVYNECEMIRKNLAFVSELEECIEAIIIDDGSTDKSINFLNSLKRENVKVLNQEHKGAGEARNLGIRHALGEYLVFFDADDEFVGQEILLTLYEKAKRNNVNICGGSFCIQNKEGRKNKFYDYEEGYTFEKEGLVYFEHYQFDYGFQRFIYKTEFIMKNEIVFPNYQRYQDPPFLVNAMFKARFFYAVTAITYIYNESNHVVWNEMKTTDLVKGLLYNLKFAEKHNLYKLYWLNIRRIYMDFSSIISGNAKAQQMVDDLENKFVLQHLLFPQKDICTESDLYFRILGNGYYDWEKSVIILNSGSRVEMDTYFNAFSAHKWKEYTNIKNVDCLLEVKGHLKIYVYNKRILYGKVEEKLIHAQTVCSTELKKVPIQIGKIDEGGEYVISIEACNEGCEIKGGFYFSNESMNKKNIKMALLMCTYNREKYVEENLQRISGCKDVFLKNNISVYIVDNAGTLTIHEGFENVRIFHNCNVGGAGGFTKGMIELLRKKQQDIFTHCVLMDDDIVLDPRIVRRTMDLLKNIKEEYEDAFLGGAMLRKDLQYFQVESGATWNRGEIVSCKWGLDLRDMYNCLLNEYETFCQYNAWWFCVIPMVYISEDNLPLPLFVCNDDVEYGLRNCKKLILLNGICVWHDAFESKNNSTRNYYIYRNKLIVNSVSNNEMTKKELLFDLKRMMYNEIALYRYENVLAVFEGIKDFCKGPDWLIETQCNCRHNEIQKYNKAMDSLAERNIYFDYNRYRFCCTIKDCDWLHKWVRILTINGLLLKADRCVILPICGVEPVQAYRAKQIIYFDEILNRVSLCEKNWRKILECLHKYFKVKKIIFLNYDNAVNGYKSKYGYLTSKEFWEKYLNDNYISVMDDVKD